MLSVVLVAILAEYLGLDFSSFLLTQRLQAVFPSIEKWSAISSSPETFRIVWIYIVVSSTLTIGYISLTVRPNRIVNRGSTIVVIIPFLIFLASLTFCACFLGHDFSTPSASSKHEFMVSSIVGGLSVFLVISGAYVCLASLLLIMIFDLAGLKVRAPE